MKRNPPIEIAKSTGGGFRCALPTLRDCDGEPMCVRFCETKALQYEEAGTASAKKMRATAKKVLESMRAA